MSPNLDTLRDILLDLVNDPDMKPSDMDGRPGKETKCNLAVNRICQAFGIFCFQGKLANDIVGMLKDELEGWSEVKASQAAAHAMTGGLAIAARKGLGHGHVAVIWPAALVMSGTFGKKVPWVANVGKDCGIMKMSMAFSAKKGEPSYWNYRG